MTFAKIKTKSFAKVSFLLRNDGAPGQLTMKPMSHFIQKFRKIVLTLSHHTRQCLMSSMSLITCQ